MKRKHVLMLVWFAVGVMWLVTYLTTPADASVMLAMPQVLVTVGTIIGTYGGPYAWIGWVMVAVGTVWGYTDAQSAKRKAKRDAKDAYNSGLQDRMVTLNSAESPWQVVYGETWVAPVQLPDVLTSGDKDQFKHVIFVWAAHECEAILDVTLNGVSVGGVSIDGYVVDGRWVRTEPRPLTKRTTLNNLGRATIASSGEVVEILSVTRADGSLEELQNGLTPDQVMVVGGVLRVLPDYVDDWANRLVVIAYVITSTNSRLRITHHLGAPGQLADANLMAECPSDWHATDRLQGLCYSVIRYDLNDAEFQGGPQEARALIRGKKLYDPRTETTAWTANAALCTADYVMAEYGKQAVLSQVSMASVIAAANDCDETVTYKLLDAEGAIVETHTGPRYTCNGAIRTDGDPDNFLDQLSQAMGGTVTRTAGLWELQAGVYTTPVMDLTDADCVGSVELVEGLAGHESFNSVRGKFYDPAKYGQNTDYPAYRNAAFVSEDGGAEWQDLPYPFTNEVWRCWQLARIQVERVRVESMLFPAKRRALQLKPGQRVRVTNRMYSIDSVVYRVLKKEWQPGKPVKLSLTRDDISFYDLIDAPKSLASTSSSTTDPWRVPEVSGLVLSSGNSTLLRLSDGTVIGRVKVTVNPSADTLVIVGGGLQIQYRVGDLEDAPWQSAPEGGGTATEAYLVGLDEGRLYLVRARWRNAIGVFGDWVAKTVLNLGKLEAPSDVADLAAVSAAAGVQISWAPNTDADYKETELRVLETDADPGWVPDWEAATSIFKGKLSSTVWGADEPGDWTVLAKHFDTSDNFSAIARADVEVIDFAAALGIFARLTTEAIVLTATSAGVVGDYTHASTVLSIEIGGVDEVGTWTVTATGSTGLTVTATGATVALTAILDGTDSGRISIEATKVGSPTINRVVTVSKAKAGTNGTNGTPGTPGANGLTPYFHVKWSNDGGSTFTASAGETPGAYMGTVTDFNVADPTTVGAYVWALVKGADGTNGTPGTPGTNGLTPYFHVKWSNDGGSTFTASAGETPGAYIGTCTDFNVADPTTVGAYVWALVKGADGTNGTPGTPGANGLTPYFHVKWSNDGGSTFTASAGETPGAYIGTCTDFNVADPTTVGAYVWALVKGADGTNGTPGTPGTNGLTPYFHVKWSNDGGSTFTASAGETPGAYIGTCTDFNVADPTTVGAYVWALVKGADGTNGIPGTPGADGLTPYLHIKWSNDGGSTFTASSGETPGAYIGTVTDFNAADPTTVGAYVWALVKGADGTNGTSTYLATVYQQATSAPSAPTGGSYNFNSGTLTAPSGWSTSQPTTSPTTTTYSVQFQFSTTTPAITVTGGTWSTPVAIAGGNPSPFVASFSPGYATSVGKGPARNVGTRTVSVSGGVSPYIYKWTLEDWAWSDDTFGPTWYFNGGSTSASETLYISASAPTLLTGTLVCEVIDATGRISRDSKSVSVNIT